MADNTRTCLFVKELVEGNLIYHFSPFPFAGGVISCFCQLIPFTAKAACSNILCQPTLLHPLPWTTANDRACEHPDSKEMWLYLLDYFLFNILYCSVSVLGGAGEVEYGTLPWFTHRIALFLSSVSKENSLGRGPKVDCSVISVLHFTHFSHEHFLKEKLKWHCESVRQRLVPWLSAESSSPAYGLLSSGCAPWPPVWGRSSCNVFLRFYKT